MICIYFSGTGNTKYCAEKFLAAIGEKVEMYAIENKSTTEAINSSEHILLAYPIYYSNLPKIVRDFIIGNKSRWRGKNIFILCTMGLFSGDGAGCAARILRKFGARVIGGLHLKMPDCIGDVKALKKSIEQNRALVRATEKKITVASDKFKQGKPTHDGLSFFSHIAGLFGQRLWFRGKTMNYTDKLKIDSDKCTGCGKCVLICPMKNISVQSGKACADSSCTMCYRCIANCPAQAITLIGSELYEQVKIEKYLS